MENQREVKSVKYVWLYVALFGVFYFAFVNNNKHAIISLSLGIITGGLSWLIYPFFAKSIMIKFWEDNGYEVVDK